MKLTPKLTPRKLLIPLAAAFALGSLSPTASARQYWHLDSLQGITWNVAQGQAHSDHIEMAGKRVATVLRYGVEADGAFHINKSMVWPMLRTIPNDTHASLMRRFNWNPLDAVTVNGRALTNERVKNISLRGALKVESEFRNGYYGDWKLTRTFFPSTELPALVESYTLTNIGNNPLRVEVPQTGFTSQTDPAKGVGGAFTLKAATQNTGVHYLKPGESVTFSAFITAGSSTQKAPDAVNPEQEYASRMALVDGLTNNLVLQTPDSTLNRMFDFAKLRASESIYATQGGPLHGPGGESYYAAIWANDQAEYVNPFFPFTGYDYGNQSALNSYRHFARFMNPEYKPIPSSIIAEGLDIWNGAGDRGDAAMIAYGASRYALTRADRAEAEELWPLITWCLEYCRRKINEGGVVASDSDELEGRFPSGSANLCTSSLYYDALLSASSLAKELHKPGAKEYARQAKELRKNINNYFAANVEGFDTYAYYKGNDVLRAWICIPLTMGIDERAAGTIDALFSPRLWTENGLLTQAGDKTFWDRSTLYALRGVYAVGATDKATDYLRKYSSTRLLGDHVPYAIEAWPEGGQRHLSAESGLYARIITEGLFGIRPTGFRSFTLTPRLPSDWPEMTLSHIRAFNSDFTVSVRRTAPSRLAVTLTTPTSTRTYNIAEGRSIELSL